MTDDKKQPNRTVLGPFEILPPGARSPAVREMLEELEAHGQLAKPAVLTRHPAEVRRFTVDPQMDFVGDVHGEGFLEHLLAGTVDQHSTPRKTFPQLLAEMEEERRANPPGNAIGPSCEYDPKHDSQAAQRMLQQWARLAGRQGSTDTPLPNISDSAIFSQGDLLASEAAGDYPYGFAQTATSDAVSDGRTPFPTLKDPDRAEECLLYTAVSRKPQEGTWPTQCLPETGPLDPECLSERIGDCPPIPVGLKPEEFFALLREKAAAAGITVVVRSPFDAESLQVAPSEEAPTEESQSARNLTRIITNMTQK